MKSEDVKKMAEDHADYVMSIARKMYIDAFIHGFKHGEEDAKIKAVMKELEERAGKH